MSAIPAELRSPRPQLVFLLTVVEHNQLQMLRAFGESLMTDLLAQRAEAELPPRLVTALDAYAVVCHGVSGWNEPPTHAQPERDALEIEIRASVGVMEKNEITGRAMAFVAGISEPEFRRRIEGADLAVCVVPPMTACACTQRRVQTASCGICKGQRAIPTVIPPSERIKPRAEVEAQFPPAGGGASLVDASGKPFAKA